MQALLVVDAQNEFSPAGRRPVPNHGAERLFEKDIFGAFTGTDLEGWLRGLGVTEVVIAGFYTHVCVSTSAREALVRGFDVVLDPDATGARALEDDRLGRQRADDVRRSALLQLVNMGATLAPAAPVGAEFDLAARS